MWSALGKYFADPRLRQLFGRYATYCGSSPFLAPATLMLVAHVEREGVWSIEGGMHGLATALADAARSFGAVIRYGEEVSEVLISCGRAGGVRLKSGERIEADAVILNADVAAVANGLFGAAAKARRRSHPFPRALTVGDDLEPDSRRRKAFRCSATTCSSRATTPPNSTTFSGAARCRANRRSMSAPRTATTTARHRRRGAPSGSRQCPA